MRKTSIPTALTLIRIAVIPVAVGLWTLEAPHYFEWLFLIFVLSALTDFLDGWLARKWNAVTPLGAMLDQIADKLLIAAYLIMLVFQSGIPVVFAIILILRDIFISGLREFLALRSVPLPVGKGGKWKTALIMIGIALVVAGLAYNEHGIPIIIAGHLFLAIACLVSLVSAILYIKASWPYLRTSAA